MQTAPALQGLTHEALLYPGESSFVDCTLPFVREGLAADEPVLVVVSRTKIAMLRHALGDDADRVHFVDMAEAGRNPARLIPRWNDFVEKGPGAGVACRGLGEPVWAARTDAELVECLRHEALVNIAFAEGGPWRLLCPYDETTLGSAVLSEAGRVHPQVVRDGIRVDGLAPGVDDLAQAYLDLPLVEPQVAVTTMRYGPRQLRAVRDAVAGHVVDTDMSTDRAFDLLIAVNEMATNSVRHGGGTGRLRVWHDERSVLCEFSDSGILLDPLAGRRKTSSDSEGQRGLWIANQLCDLVQVRVFATGTVIRLHMSVR